MKQIYIDAREINSSTGRYTLNLLEHLQNIPFDAEFKILVPEKDLNYWMPRDSRFSVEAVPFKKFTFSEQLGFYKYLRNKNPDLVHYTMTQQPILYRANHVTTIQDLTALRFRNPATPTLLAVVRKIVYGYVIKVAAKKSKLVITPTLWVKDDVTAYTKIDPSKIIVTLESADAIKETAQPTEGLIPGNFIMYTGRPQPHKNLGRLIESFQILHKKFPDLKLVLVGRTDELFLQHKQRVGELGLTDFVVFTGFVSDGQLRWLLENCSAYIAPSLSEGFGLPGLEAMAHGAPVVSSNATCLPEVHGAAAHYFNPLSVDDMAAKITEVLENNTLRSKLVKEGHEQVKRFSWQRMANQTLEVYKKAMEDNNGN